MTIRHEDLKQLKKIAAVSKGKDTLRKIREELLSMFASPELREVREQVEAAHDAVEYLSRFFDLRCRHCSKRLAFGYTCCAACADERGP